VDLPPQKGIRFTPDPAFGGKPRELTAADYAYTYKRILDPAVKSPWLWLVRGQDRGRRRGARGRDDVRQVRLRHAASGLEVVDRYTLRIRLNAPDLRFLYVLAVPYLGAVAREVVERYGLDIGAHPVGTGAFKLGEYKRSARMVLERNPDFRVETYTPAGPVPASSQRSSRRSRGAGCRCSIASRSTSSRRRSRACSRS
jgi:ABC-type transport system substrate-binding protein